MTRLDKVFADLRAADKKGLIIYDFKNTATEKNITLELINIPAFKGSFGH